MRRALRRFGGLSGAIANRTLAARNRASRKTNPFRKGIRSVQSVAGSNRLPTRGERWSRFKNRTFCASRGESSLISSSSFAAWTVRCPPNRTIRWSIRCVAMTHCSPRIASIISSVLWRFALELGCDVARTRAIRFARSDQRYDRTARRSGASSASTRREKCRDRKAQIRSFGIPFSSLFSYRAGSQQSIRIGANVQSNARRPGRRSLAANRRTANRIGASTARHTSRRRAIAATRRIASTRGSRETKSGTTIAHGGIGVRAIQRTIEATQRRNGARPRGRNHPEKRRRRAHSGREAANSRMHGGI